MSLLKEVLADLRMLPPGPWHANNDVVHAGNRPMLVVLGPKGQPEALAPVLARLPGHLSILLTATPELLLSELDGLLRRVDELERELAFLRMLGQGDVES